MFIINGAIINTAKIAIISLQPRCIKFPLCTAHKYAYSIHKIYNEMNIINSRWITFELICAVRKNAQQWKNLFYKTNIFDASFQSHFTFKVEGESFSCFSSETLTYVFLDTAALRSPSELLILTLCRPKCGNKACEGKKTQAICILKNIRRVPREKRDAKNRPNLIKVEELSRK